MTARNSRLTRFLGKSLAPAFVAGTLLAAHAATAQQIGDVFYIDMENHNLTQPGTDPTSPAQLLGNPAAPFLNSLMTPGNPNAAQTSWASNYHNVLATPSGNNPSIHPSLPNYLWQEAGSNLGVFNDNQPYGTGGAVQTATNFSGLLQNSGISWKSYQEDTQLTANQGAVLPQSQWTVPTTNLSGTSAAYTNPYNGSNQFNYATKHDGQVYFTDTNGGTATTPNLSPSNPEAAHYDPLQQLAADLTSNAVGRYNLITPDQYNDMHSALTAGFTYLGTHYTGDQASIAEGDNFLATIIPQIEASQAYKNNGEIVIWYDETENADDFSHTIPEIVISPLAKGNAYDSTLNYTHSSDLKTLQEVFGVAAPGGGYLGDANTPGIQDLSDFYKPGVIPAGLPAVPESGSTALLALGLPVLGGLLLRARKRSRLA